MGCGQGPAPTLVRFLAELTALHPGRSTASDGICASNTHTTQNPDSDHERGEAADFTDDPAHGVDNWAVLDGLRMRRDPRVKYGISDRRMFSSYATSTREAWEWGPYTGSNPHTTHGHLSIWPAARNSTARWLTPHPATDPEHPDEKEKDPMAVTRLVHVKDKPGPAAIVSWDGAGKTVQNLKTTSAWKALSRWEAGGIPTLAVTQDEFDDIVKGKAAAPK